MVRFGAVNAGRAKFKMDRGAKFAGDLGLWIRIDRCGVGDKTQVVLELDRPARLKQGE